MFFRHAPAATPPLDDDALAVAEIDSTTHIAQAHYLLILAGRGNRNASAGIYALAQAHASTALAIEARRANDLAERAANNWRLV